MSLNGSGKFLKRCFVKMLARLVVPRRQKLDWYFLHPLVFADEDRGVKVLRYQGIKAAAETMLQLRTHLNIPPLLQTVLAAKRGPHENKVFVGYTRFASFVRHRNYDY